MVSKLYPNFPFRSNVFQQNQDQPQNKEVDAYESVILTGAPLKILFWENDKKNILVYTRNR